MQIHEQNWRSPPMPITRSKASIRRFLEKTLTRTCPGHEAACCQQRPLNM